MGKKFTICKECGEEIAKTSKKCPKCGAKNKKPIIKKWWFWLIVVLLVISFASGGNSDAPTDSTKTTGSTVASNPDPAESAPDATPDTTVATEPQVVFEEITAVDNDNCIIKITGIDPSNIFGYKVNLFFESKSADKTYMFSIRGASVNGIDIPVTSATEVAPGKKANAEVILTNDVLANVDYTDIELKFYVYDYNDWMADPVAEESVHIYPYGEENATKYIREPKDTDTILVDNEYVTAIITSLEMDAIWGYSANIYLVNKTDVEVMFAVDEASINGYMIDPFWAKSVRPGMCAFGAISWSESSLEENGITTVEEIEFVLRAHDYQDLFADDYVNQVFTLTP